ncbi:MAG: hypothetical protein Tsb002_29660 [Wenzhouxiangellaceae bacterium]
MITYTSKDAKNHFGKVIDASQKEPVIVEKHGRAVAVVLSHQAYEDLKSAREKAEKLEAIEAVREFVQQGLDSGAPVPLDMDAMLDSLHKKHLDQSADKVE